MIYHDYLCLCGYRLRLPSQTTHSVHHKHYRLAEKLKDGPLEPMYDGSEKMRPVNTVIIGKLDTSVKRREGGITK